MSLTHIIRPILLQRLKKLDAYANKAQDIQMHVLQRLLQKAGNTEWGIKHNYAHIKSYEQFTAHTPVNTYEELKGYIDRMRQGEKDVLWPGQVKWYAKSSGTTNDKSKFIPVSKDGLKDTHYAGGTDAVVWDLRNNPKSRLFDGSYMVLLRHAP